MAGRRGLEAKDGGEDVGGVGGGGDGRKQTRDGDEVEVRRRKEGGESDQEAPGE